MKKLIIYSLCLLPVISAAQAPFTLIRLHHQLISAVTFRAELKLYGFRFFNRRAFDDKYAIS